MMLTVTWINATRAGKERAEVERIYGARLLDLFGTVDAAHKAKEDWHRAHQPPIHHWTTYNKISEIDATKGLLRSEAERAAFIIKFTEDDFHV